MLSSENHKLLSDSELVHLYKESGDLTILGELFSRYMTLVYGVCMKYLKDREESRDAVMHIFERVVESLRVHEVAHFKSWLYVTSRNHCLMYLRSLKGKNFQDIPPYFMENDGSMHPEEEPEMESNLSKLEHCIEQLVAEQQHCVKLFYMQQKCYKEIVQLTGFDHNKVKSYIQNGKRNLKICMEHHG